jgi:hypothetical protein
MDFDFTTETITPDNASQVATVGGTGALVLPVGTTAQQPATVAGAIRWNTSLTRLEYYNGSAWVSFSTGGTVTSVAVTGGTTGLITSGGPVTVAGTITLSGTLAISNGGTGQTTAAAAFNALNPMTTTGDLIYESATSTAARLAIGTSGQVLTVSSGVPAWSTVGAASYSVNVGPSGTIAWSLVSGTTYNATITHNLGTQNVVVQCQDISNNDVVVPDLIVVPTASTVTIQVVGNTRTLRVVVLANGASIAAGASTPSSIIVQGNGVALSGTYTTVNFATGLTATNSGGGVATIAASNTVIRTMTYFATSFDSPNNSDWAVNALAPTVSDPTNAAINVRQFSNTTEQGVGFFMPIPSNATTFTITYRGRAQTAPGAAATLQLNIYFRHMPSNAAISAWSGASALTSVTVPTNAYTQYYTYGPVNIAGAGLTAGDLYQVELTRNVGVAGNLASNWLMSEFDVSFS